MSTGLVLTRLLVLFVLVQAVDPAC